MKTWILFLSILSTSICISQTVGPSVYESEANPDGIVFPRMTTSERDALQPNEGQCIYNTITKELNCFEGTQWVTANIQNELFDSDSDTKISVERFYDEDKIRFDLMGSQVLSLEKNIYNVFRIDYNDQFENLVIGKNSGINLRPNNFGNGTKNTLIGAYAGNGMTTGQFNTLVGNSSGINLNGSGNTFLGIFTGDSFLNTGINNTFLGMFTGSSNQTGSYNTFVGVRAGQMNITGERNVFIGGNSSYAQTSGSQSVIIGDGSSSNVTNGNFGSVIIGYAAGQNGQTLARNVIIGKQAGLAFSSTNFIEGNVILGNQAGFSLNGSNNIFIGNQAGYSESGSNKLYIEGSNSNSPLIYGEFDNDLVKVNGTLHISETAKLTPLSSPPTCTSAEEGLLYFNVNNRTLQVCKGSLGWKEVLTN